MHRILMMALWAMLTVVLFSPQPGFATGKTNLMLIFDASGSMWGQIDGKAKITIAKEAMDLIVNDLPDDINIGLVAYGHRRKGDCDDVETLIPLGPINAKAFLAKINELNPKGKTPMVRSIRQTAESIKHLEDETTILLVSDGEETCDPDPCNFVAELEKLGIKFVLHVVGFDVGGKTEEQLKCMAKAGGGEYFPAKDATKFKSALDTVVKKTVAQNLIVSSYDNKNAPVSARINVLDQSGKVVATDAGRRVSFGLEPGTYTITVKPETMSETKTVAGIVVTEDKVTKQKVVFAKSQIIVTMKDGAGKPVNGYIRIVNTQTGQYAAQGDHTGKTSGFIVSPGEYEVITECANTGAKVISDRFSLRAGENRNVNAICADARIGVLVINAVGKPTTGYIRIVDVPRDTYVEQEDSRSTMRFFNVPPGKYKVDVECASGSRLRTMPFDIRAGQENRVTINCETKVIKTTLPKPRANASARPQTGTAATPRPQSSASSAQTPQAPTAGSPKQTARETVQTNPQDMQAMADQMQAQAQIMAAQAQADAMAQMQTAMAGMPGGGQMTPQGTAQQAATQQTSGTVVENPQDTALPQVADGPAGYGQKITTIDDSGAQGDSTHIGARPSAVDYSKVGAQDTGGGLDDIDNERPDQGDHPYQGMSKEEMQAAFARDMGMQGPPGGSQTNQNDFRVGDNPLDTRRQINRLGYRLDGCEEKARTANRNDILNRIDVARGNLDNLGKQLKNRAHKAELQQLMDRCVQEINAIQISIAQGQ
ncbi:VWA domain-containing protein [Pseudodesulfovibrio sp.]|nr:VWA domain-containing protein [Pseudodesulfovibrio sp.]